MSHRKRSIETQETSTKHSDFSFYRYIFGVCLEFIAWDLSFSAGSCATILRMAWVIVGLGNPGERYDSTRHNCGRMAVEFFARTAGFREFREDVKKKAHVSGGLVGKTAVALVLPDTFMNKSGFAAGKFVKGSKAAERMVVVHDDLDLPMGKIKISHDRSSGGHKGVDSIIRAVKTQRFPRVRIGVSPTTASGAVRKPEGEKVVNNFILTPFRASELVTLKPIFKKVADALETIIRDGREMAMNEFN
jgi:PTH1 family peptidyl-tRNA hydrolase